MADYNLFIYHGNLIFNLTFNPIILLEEQETQCSHIFGPSVTTVLVRGQRGKPRKVGSGVKANHSHSVGLQVGSLMTEKGWIYICREEILEYFLNLKNWKYIFIQIDSLLKEKELMRLVTFFYKCVNLKIFYKDLIYTNKSVWVERLFYSFPKSWIIF